MNRIQAVLDRLNEVPDLSARRDAPLAPCTRFGIGGPADILIETPNTGSFVRALDIARSCGVPTTVIGGGTNLVVADDGYRGAVLKLTSDFIESNGETILVAAGTVLQNLVDYTVDHGLRGLETMTGIPGSVGGAIYGNAGAYGHSMMERVSFVSFFDGEKVRNFSGAECGFDYRTSIFKSHKDWIIFSAVLTMLPGDSAALRETAGRILDTRNKKYPPAMKCAGSIFKNFLLRDLPPEVAAIVPPNAVIEGKVPSAWFLEQVGAKGMRAGDIRVADYHANLIYNEGHGTAREVARIIRELKRRIRERWGIAIEEEVQYVGFRENS
ncbi:MAG TPA: UDP-N-acetylmuramate dehydrogenase [Bryobacteraceae bacterium]|nr:UDP-N-acetylmuramate dehydrogenase [Bryobacteraceae bacterium]